MKETIASWFFWLLGVDIQPLDGGTNWHLEGVWKWNRHSLLALVVFAILSAIFVLYFYFRERSTARRPMRLLLASIRMTLIFLALVMIFQLTLHFSKTSLPHLAIVFDRSASMKIEDVYASQSLNELLRQRAGESGLSSPSRFNIARSILLKDDGVLLKGLEKRYTLNFYSVASALQKQSSDVDVFLKQLREMNSNGESSRLGYAGRRVLNDLRGTSPAAIVMFTDGITTEGPTLINLADYARGQAIPLFLVGIGSSERFRNLELDDLLVDQVVFVNDYVDFDFKLTPYGLKGNEIEVVLKNKKTGEIYDRRRLPAGDDGQPQREKLSHRPTKVGTIEYVVEVTNLKEELKGKELSVSAEVEIRDDPVKVLMVQAYPNYEFQFLKNLLERDRTVDLQVVLQEADVEYPEQDRSALRVFPVSRDELFEYDVLIIGDVNMAYFSRSVMENIAAFVKEKGKGVLFISGERFHPDDYAATPLADLLPFALDDVVVPDIGKLVTEGFRTQPTLLGMTSPHMQLGDNRAESEAIWQGLPEMYWMLEATELKPGSRVLVEHPTKIAGNGQKVPLIALYHLPPGKVLWHAVDGTYRWRFRLGDAVYARYWIQAIRYLSRAKLVGKKSVELSADKTKYQRITPVKLFVRFFDERLTPAADDGVSVIIEGGGHRFTVPLSRSTGSRAIFEGIQPNLPIGSYTARIATPTLDKTPVPIRFEVEPPQREAERKEMNIADLQKAADISRGRFFDVENLNGVFANLPQGKPVKVASLDPVPLWSNWRMLLLFITLLVIEWLLRKRVGML